MRPREKLLRYGPGILSVQELLAIIIRTGSRDANAIQLAESILYQFNDLRGVNNAGIEELCAAAAGIGNAKAAQIKAALELGRRLSQQDSQVVRVKSPQDVAAWVMEDLRYLQHEQFRILLLNTKNVIIACEEVSRGSLNSSIVHPREVFARAIRRSAAAVILVHNHPSGDPTPSQEDINITRRLVEVGRLVGIEVLDHLVIGDGVFASLKEKGYV
ncbi:MAG: DNA repair protein RadC [Eubacteriales bacterium]|jgi:DNA repair protein RadC|nr:DNA repair protein RadC [Eubacteriales bacterium]